MPPLLPKGRAATSAPRAARRRATPGSPPARHGPGPVDPSPRIVREPFPSVRRTSRASLPLFPILPERVPVLKEKCPVPTSHSRGAGTQCRLGAERRGAPARGACVFGDQPTCEGPLYPHSPALPWSGCGPSTRRCGGTGTRPGGCWRRGWRFRRRPFSATSISCGIVSGCRLNSTWAPTGTGMSGPWNTFPRSK